MKHVLCFGDSNTWGYIPGQGRRYDEHTRWTGVLADALGEGWCIHEDGVNARTTIFDEATKPWLNGLPALLVALQSQKPLDLLVISLGTNDLKHGRRAQESAAGLERLILTAQTIDALYPASEPVFRDGKPAILVVSPIAVGEMPADSADSLAGTRGESLRFPQVCAQVCAARGVPMLDAQTVAEPSPVDHVHMSPENHRALGLAVAEMVRKLLP